MRQGDLSKLARVQVDIPNSLDDLWTLDIKKSTATPPEDVKQNLGVIIEKISEGSKRTWTYRGKKETRDDVIHMWNRMVSRDGGIFYEINPDYPMIEDIVQEYPGIRSKLDVLLKQISMSLPLNSLYIDLTNDEKLANDSDMASKEIIELVKTIVMQQASIEERYSTIEALKLAEPFCAYSEEIDHAKEKGEFND